nr:MAG TPA: hypothetical protein [Bacteriophage sp.]
MWLLIINIKLGSINSFPPIRNTPKFFPGFHFSTIFKVTLLIQHSI